MTEAQKHTVVECLNLLADLASLRDMDVTVLALQRITSVLGIQPKDIPCYEQLMILIEVDDARQR